MPKVDRFLHARYDWTTGALDNGNEWRKFCAVPHLYPLRFLVCTLFNKGGSRGAFRLPGRAGIISIVRWNLRPVIFGVEFLRCVIAQAFCSQKSFREITLNYAKLRQITLN